MPQFKTTFAAITLSALAAAVLVACGGGGSTPPSTQAQQVAVQTYITDNLATEYAKVWVSIEKITVLDSTGAEVTLVDATAAPMPVNLSSLADVAQFMSTVTIPAGLYTGINVTMGNAVQLVSLDGATTTNAQFSATAGDFVWRVRNVSLDSTSGQFLLDFNLAKFTYDATTNLVMPHMVAKHGRDAFTTILQRRGEAHGVVTAVDTVNNTFTVNDPVAGAGIVVSLAADAVIQNESTGAVLTLADLVVGMRIEVKGTVTPGATAADPVTITATVIEVEPTSSTGTIPRLRGEGSITAINGNLVTIDLVDANFLPGTSSLVLDIGSARFAHGQLSDLLVGLTIGFRGTASATSPADTIDVRNLDVRGAASEHERKAHPDTKYAGLIGTIATLNTDGTFTVAATKSVGLFVQAGTYTVDPSQANYLGNSANCVLKDATVRALGTLVDTTLTAKFIGIEGCGGQMRGKH
ncbi:MAG: DUF4382 domain-containing protein [Burkholderiales bacterium]|nr:DUF4382 domain-containing protein [Burkholderiales bacterium]